MEYNYEDIKGLVNMVTNLDSNLSLRIGKFNFRVECRKSNGKDLDKNKPAYWDAIDRDYNYVITIMTDLVDGLYRKPVLMHEVSEVCADASEEREMADKIASRFDERYAREIFIDRDFLGYLKFKEDFRKE